ncbi:DEAD-box type RNA helicase [Tulasnella sp. JGI-2019a]|nr:DEAD-box type RNA helicase [Tulasnella sp. JGI-2019a]
MAYIGALPSAEEAAKVGLLLKDLRENPVNSKDPTVTSSLLTCSSLLYSVQYPDSSSQPPHWFCPKTPTVAIEAATFLLRLHAYASAVDWKDKLANVLKGCSACVSGYRLARTRSDETYLSCFKPGPLKGLRESVDKWELAHVLSCLTKAGNLEDDSLGAAPSAVVFHALDNPHLIENVQINSLFLERTPNKVFTDWPEKPPAGLLYLAASGNTGVQKWASEQIGLCPPIASLPTGDPVLRIFTSLVKRLQASDQGSLAVETAGSEPGVTGSTHLLPPPLLWTAFPALLKVIVTRHRLEILKNLNGTDFIGMVLGHLHDNNEHLSYVLDCFQQLLAVFGDRLWAGLPAEFPQVKVDALHDNPAFESLIKATVEPTLLRWYGSYLQSIWKTKIFPDALAKILAFTCDTVQHGSYSILCRSMIMSVIFGVLRTAYGDAQNKRSEPHLLVIRQHVCHHAQQLVAVAFGRAHRDQIWAEARSEARMLFREILSSDARRTHELLMRLSSIARAGDKAVRSDLGRIPFGIHEQLWMRMYEAFPSDDADAMAILIHVTAASAHLDILKPEVYRVRAKGTEELKDLRIAYATEISSYHRALEVMRSGFGTAVTSFAGSARTPILVAFLNGDEVVASLMAVMFSPVETLHTSAQEFATQAYDADGRDACFRAYFKHHPALAFRGTFAFLKTVEGVVSGLLEACTISRSTVLCLTDIIEVLCSKPDGLLFLPSFGHDDLPLSETTLELWNQMSYVIAAIFKETPVWSSYIESHIMIIWMRDALIFARDMVSQYSVFNAAASDTLQTSMVMASPRKATINGTETAMMGKLEVVLEQATKWLKLTDLELLHQSVELLKLILKCFDEATDLTPPASVISKLESYTSGRAGSKMELNREQMLSLEDAIAPFMRDRGDSIDVQQIQRIQKLALSSNGAAESGPESTLPSEDSDDDIEYLGQAHATKTRAPSEKRQNNAPNILDQLMISSRGQAKSGTVQAPKLRLDVTSGPPRKLSMSVGKGLAKGSSKSGHHSSGKIRELREASRAHSRQYGLPPPGRKLPSREPKFAGSTDMQPKSSKSSAASSPAPDEDSDGEDEDDEDEDGGQGLAGLSKLQKTAKVAKVTVPERRGIVLMDGGVRDQARARIDAREQARRTQLRLKPDLTPLHRLILSWDYDHDGDEPPNFDSKNLRSVPDTFESHDEYCKVMWPLLSLECWSQVAKAKEEPQEKTIWQISQKQYVDSWLDLDLTIISSLPNKWYLAETDIVLLRQTAGNKCLLAKTQGFKSNARGVNASVRCIPSRVDIGLNIGTQWRVEKIFSLSTVHREYAALMGLPFYDLFDSIIKPAPARLAEIPADRIQKAMKAYSVNEPQATAILGSLGTEGFALIQGPPGTGKTSTICGLASEFLSRRGTGAFTIRAGRGPEKAPPSKLLVCAPSNAAIDEVAKRLRDGLRDAQGMPMTPKVVRIGNEASINISVKDISLDALVAAKMNAQPTKDKGIDTSDELTRLRKELEEVNRQRGEKLEFLQSVKENPNRLLSAEAELKAINAKRSSINQRLNQARDRQTDNKRAMDAAQRKYRQEVLHEADIICSTLSGSGHESLEQYDFETVVIDEAAQSVEISSLIPLKYQCKRCILVGDPQQLAPTVISMKASQKNYQQSLFVRIQKHGPDAVHLLSIQYRMHPIISKLPSKVFYSGRLQDGPGMAEKTLQPWHHDAMLPPYRFFNVARGVEDMAGSHSMRNKVEAETAVSLYNRLLRQFSKHGELDYRVGVITMYRGQLLELKNCFSQRFGRDIIGKVDFNTVDGFQGQEKDIIILSCVRAGPGVNNVGFLADVRRMNVAITRARSSLYILGHAATLERSDHVWKQIVQDARDRSCLADNVSPTTFTAPVLALVAPSILKPKMLQATTEPDPQIAEFLTPKQLKHIAIKGIAMQQTTESATESTGLGDTSGDGVSTTVDVSSDPSHPAAVRKRSITDDGQIRAPPALRNNPEEGTSGGGSKIDVPKVRPLPAKPKPKPAPSLFIPKKPQKRKP